MSLERVLPIIHNWSCILRKLASVTIAKDKSNSHCNRQNHEHSNSCHRTYCCKNNRHNAKSHTYCVQNKYCFFLAKSKVYKLVVQVLSVCLHWRLTVCNSTDNRGCCVKKWHDHNEHGYNNRNCSC